MRRPSHAAGYSWRKWQDPIDLNGGRVHGLLSAWSILFWVVCAEAGALAALVIREIP